MYIFLYMHMYVCLHTYIYIYICIYICTCVCLRVFAMICVSNVFVFFHVRDSSHRTNDNINCVPTLSFMS